MAKTLSKIGIESGQPITAGEISQSIDALTGTEAYDITISGSFKVIGPTSITGSTVITGSTSITGSIDVSGSIVNNLTSSYSVTSSLAQTSITANGLQGQPSINVTDISASGLLYISASQVSGQTYGVLVRDEVTGKVYHTGSYATGIGAIGNLQLVTDNGSTTTNAITSSALRINNGNDLTPNTSSTPPSQLQIQGNGYTGFIALDSSSMYIGNNSQTQSISFVRNGGSGLQELLNLSSSISSSLPISSSNLHISTISSSNGEISSFTGDFTGSNGNYIKISRVSSPPLYVVADEVSNGVGLSSQNKIRFQVTPSQDPTGSIQNPTLELGSNYLSGSVFFTGTGAALAGNISASGNITANVPLIANVDQLVVYDTSSGELGRMLNPIQSTISNTIFGDDTKSNIILGTSTTFQRPSSSIDSLILNQNDDTLKLGDNIELSGSQGLIRTNILLVNSGSVGAESLGFLQPGDGMQVSISSSNSYYSPNTSLTPNPAVFLTEQSSPATSFAGSGSAIQIVSSGRFPSPGLSSKNAITQLASIAAINNTHAANFALGTRNAAGNITEKFRITHDGKTTVNGAERGSQTAFEVSGSSLFSGSIETVGIASFNSSASFTGLPTSEPSITGSLWISGSSPNHPNSGYLMIFNP